MSRYIRTKDGEIFDTEVNGVWETNDGTIGVPTINGIVVTPKAFITRQADTIEELCDEAVVIDQSNYNKPVVILCGGNGKPFPTAKTFYPFATIYGAIWTEKGLIYRAKMNNKGELELL